MDSYLLCEYMKMQNSIYIWGGVNIFVFIWGGGGEGGGGNTLLQHLQYGSKYIKYYVIILFVEQYKDITNGNDKSRYNNNIKLGY